MPTRRRDLVARLPGLRKAWLVAALLAAGCGGEAVLLVPFFTFGFEFNGTLAGADHQVFLNLNPNAPTTATGAFDASTMRLDADFVDVSGSYSGCTMVLQLSPQLPATALPALLAANYDGRFTGPNTIQLTPQGGTQPVLTVVRAGGQTDSRPQTC